jgi:predicted GIY-YIG superfamily endonuclease
MTTLYVLALQNGKYYVGKTDNVQERVCQHFAGIGAAWTQLHRPVRLLRTVPYTGPLSEDTLVKEMMLRHGVDAVRGGSYSNSVLTQEQQTILRQELRGARDTCFHCGGVGHMATICNKKEKLEYDNGEEEEDDDECFRCGRYGHWASECYARYDIEGYEID